MVYSAITDLKALLDAYSGTWTNAPTIFRADEGYPSGDLTTKGLVELVDVKLNSVDAHQAFRSDNYRLKLNISYDGQTTDTKVKLLAKEVHECIIAENKTGDRAYYFNVSTMEYSTIFGGLTMFISMREEDIPL